MDGRQDPHVLFQEVQDFRKSGLFTALLIGSAVTTISGFLLWLNFPPDSSQRASIPLLALGIGAAAAIAILILVLCAKLTTEVKRSGLYIQYFPFPPVPPENSSGARYSIRDKDLQADQGLWRLWNTVRRSGQSI